MSLKFEINKMSLKFEKNQLCKMSLKFIRYVYQFRNVTFCIFLANLAN